MGDEYGVIPGDYVSQVENEGNFTKETAQAEWFEKFGIRDTRDWRQLLEIDPAKAKEALQHVVDNREHFPQYDDNWAKDREKECAQAEWFEKFGIRDTRDWRQLLEIDPAKAKEALQHVVDNREHFPQYDDNWVKDREKELDK